jgi:hypothetical protein
MERLFSPCTRLHVRLRNPGLFQELNLDVSTEELLSAERAFTYADLYAMLGNISTFAWFTPNATVGREYGGSATMAWRQLDESHRLCFRVDGKDIIAAAHSSEHLLEICNIVLRLLAVSVVHSVRVVKRIRIDDPLINAPTLAYLMEQCQSSKFFII